VLQEREYEPLGATSSVKADVRIIAATNRNLSEMVNQKSFREDLFYRLNIVKLEIPPLRNRKEDVPLLVEYFIKKLNIKQGKNITGISDDVLRLFMNYGFPGNVRELENLLEHAFVMCQRGEIQVEHLPREFKEILIKTKTDINDVLLQSRFKESEAEVVKEALRRNQGLRGKTARELGINPSTLWRKMKRLGITES
jgi:transcriptional regulator with PAS, ATPase and Fis domain